MGILHSDSHVPQSYGKKFRGARSGTPALVTAIDATPAGWGILGGYHRLGGISG